jgi:predicted Rossmann fold nucleotide-binding protein DprA/Smf involved in DNA uptake
MGRLADRELVALLLTQRLVDGATPPLKAAEFWALAESVPELGVLLGCSVGEITRLAHVEQPIARRLATLLDGATAFAFALDDAQQVGLGMVSGLSPRYPTALRQRLGRAAPPVLYALGSLELMGGGGLGIVGSRAVSEAGAAVAKDAAVVAVRSGHHVVSGGARGVDRLAMHAAVDAGGRVVGVLADSLLRTGREPEMRRAISDGSVCLCTPYKPTAAFTAANALGRNKLIYALSTATLVVECVEGTGGTWAGAVEALRARTAPVMVLAGTDAAPGNAALIQRGARACDRVEHLMPLPHLEAAPTADQLALGL